MILISECSIGSVDSFIDGFHLQELVHNTHPTFIKKCVCVSVCMLFVSLLASVCAIHSSNYPETKY